MPEYRLNRVFGEASLIWEVDESGRPSVVLRADGYRGFEVICQGAHGEILPDLLSRRCGVDSLYHRIGACIALERALKVQLPDVAWKIRELILACQLFRRHSLTMILHVLPDLFFPASDLSVRNLVGLFRVDRDVARRMMSLAALGERILRELCLRSVHPVIVVPGGITGIPREESIQALKGLITDAMELVKETSRLVKMLLRRNEELVMSLSIPADIEMAAMTPPFGPSWEGLRVLGLPEGTNVDRAEELIKRAERFNLPHTMLEACRLKDQVGKVSTGPLARVNSGGGQGSEVAEAELEELKRTWGFPFKGILLSHAIRMTEMMMALERIHRLLSRFDEWKKEESRNELAPGSGRGAVALEGAEGIHLYEVAVEDGYISSVSYHSPLQWNITAMLGILQEEALMAGEEIGGPRWQAKSGLSVRSFAPCFFCASG